MKYFNVIVILFTMAFLVCCTVLNLNVKEEFPQLHPTNPIIIIPGIKGSQLVDPVTEKVIWGKIFDLEVVDPHKALIKPDKDGIELPIDKRPITSNRDRIVPTSVLTKYKLIYHIAEIEAYQSLIEVFTKCGLSEGDIQQCTINDNLYLFAYDWRRDLVETAQLLSDRIEEIKRSYNNPNQKVDIIAHSMGGLIAMYYMMYGSTDVVSDGRLVFNPSYEGAENIGKAFMISVPYGGNIFAFKSLHNGDYLGPSVTVSNLATFTMPSLYQLLPIKSNIFVDKKGNHVELDIFNIENWLKHGISIFNQSVWREFEQNCEIIFPGSGKELSIQRRFDFIDFIDINLKRGKRFQSALQNFDWEKTDVTHYVVAGDCKPTLKAVKLIKNDNASYDIKIVKKRRFKEKFYHTELGDGTILISSQAENIQTAFDSKVGCYEHRTITAEKTVHRFIIDSLKN